ncbi:hypothetical protein Peur_005388 [Populus x canadensis]
MASTNYFQAGESPNSSPFLPRLEQRLLSIPLSKSSPYFFHRLRFFLLQPETSNPYKENRAIFFSRPNFKPLKAILNSPSQTKAADNAKDNEDASTLRQIYQGHVLRRQVTGSVKLLGSCWLQSLWRMRWEHKSCTVMALLDGWMLRRHKSWLKVLFWRCVFVNLSRASPGYLLLCSGFYFLLGRGEKVICQVSVTGRHLFPSLFGNGNSHVSKRVTKHEEFDPAPRINLLAMSLNHLLQNGEI